MSGHIPLLVRWLTRIGVLPRAAIAQLDARHAPNAQSVLDAGRLAQKTLQLLDQLDQDVVLIARTGQNLTQFGLKHSHIGYAVRDLRRGEWGIVHLLNAEDGTRSAIFREGLVNYYSDTPYKFEASVLTLPRAYQAQLRELLLDDPLCIHCQDYSLTSHPWSLTTQNSNQWVLELLACVLGGIEPRTRPNAQAWLRERGFTGTTLRIKLHIQWVGPLLRDSIRFDDQPVEERQADRVTTVTVDSVYEWLKAAGVPEDLRGEVREIALSL